MSCSSKRNRLVGSCISTLVSRTNSLVVALAGLCLDFIAVVGVVRSEGLDGIEDLGGVAGNLDAAPFAPKQALPVDEEGAALDAADLLAIQVLHLDDGEEGAGGFVGIDEQFEGQAELGLEPLMRAETVARNAEHRAAELGEAGVEVAELLGFGGAAGGVVLRIEVEDQRTAAMVGEAKIAAGAGQAEVGEGLVAHWTTLGVLKAVVWLWRRVIHRAWLWATRPAPPWPGGELPTAAKHPVGNPCSIAGLWCAAALTRRRFGADGVIRLPCSRGDCQWRWPLDGPHETRSPRGAGRPRRATGCSAKVESQERRSVSVPRGLPARRVIPQLAGDCP